MSKTNRESSETNVSTSELPSYILAIGDCAEQAISKFIDKIARCEAAVLDDTDPEPLHKMRVGMRRLRTVLQILSPLVILPEPCTQKAVGRLAKVLGIVRDLDIMGETLQQASLQDIPARERQILAEVSTILTHHRHKAFVKMSACLTKEYRVFEIACKMWLDDPKYHNQYVASQFAVDVLPDLLLPSIAAYFLHDGWFIADDKTKGSQLILHDLRKYTKRIRYQTEYFFPYLNADATPFLPVLELTQELLGQMQDGLVLRKFISNTIGKETVKKLPVLNDIFAKKNIQAWNDWQSIKIELCSQDWRRSLRIACILSNSKLSI
jgi:CHAD domain-containing protein